VIKMTIAVSLNLADGIILGVDSAITLNDAKGGVIKVYENAEKLFQLGKKSVGIATYGIGNMGTRGIGSYLREFELLDPNNVVTQKATMAQIVEELRIFFLAKYKNIIVPLVEKQSNKKFEEMPDNEKPILGLAVGGFSDGEYLSEVWEILIPTFDKANSARLRRSQGNYGSDWFALCIPIVRYFKGYDPILINELENYFKTIRGSDFSAQEQIQIQSIIQKHEYPVPFIAMPIKEGVALVKFLVEMVINHHRFTIGAPVVGGKVHLGLVTYKGENFQIIE
jgi:hypothetical protein